VASPTKIYMTRVRLKTKNAGRKRKNRLENHGTTPSKAVFFGDVEAPRKSPAATPAQ
jgi:hypothetical protein